MYAATKDGTIKANVTVEPYNNGPTTATTVIVFSKQLHNMI